MNNVCKNIYIAAALGASVTLATEAKPSPVDTATAISRRTPTINEDATPPAESERTNTRNLILSDFRNVGNGALTWEAAQTALLEEVQCNGVRIGQVDFFFRPFSWIKAAGAITDYAGVCIEGGFVQDAQPNEPCGPSGYKENTTFRWVQMLNTSHPLAGHAANTYYVDVRAGVNPKTTPWYPNRSNDGQNPGGTTWNKLSSMYDAPKRYQRNNNIGGPWLRWDAMNMLVCENGGKINVVSHFTYGYTIEPGVNDDGAVNMSGYAPNGFTNNVHPGIVQTLSDLLGTVENGIRKGFAVSTGCCCPTPKATDAESDATGITEITITVPEDRSLYSICIFPRNHPIDWAALGEETSGFWVKPSSFMGAPLLPWQDEPYQHLQEGVYLFPIDGNIVGPAEFTVTIPLAGHESFVDMYFLDENYEWNPWVQQTNHLLGDMNDDGEFTPHDLELLELATYAPDTYLDEYPWMNHIFVGDLSHNNMLDDLDFELLAELVFDVYEETDVVDLDPCPTDMDGNGLTDVMDLLQVIGVWDACNGCPEDINHDGLVGIQDLLTVLDAWGACPHG